MPNPLLGVISGGDLSLSGAALVELMRAVLAKGASFRFRAKGWSMAPFIRDGDVICVSPLAASGPMIGDVVAFFTPEMQRLVVHRVVLRRGDACVSRGDNVPGMTDGTISGKHILGRVTRVTRDGRDVWLGLGPERRLIALLSRTGLLPPARLRLATIARRLVRRCQL
jgi:hypothetical protein